MIDLANAQCFTAWGTHLTRLEVALAVHACVRSWCDGKEEALLSIDELSRILHVSGSAIEEALVAMFKLGAVKSVTFLWNARSVSVTLTPRWKSPEDSR